MFGWSNETLQLDATSCCTTSSGDFWAVTPHGQVHSLRSSRLLTFVLVVRWKQTPCIPYADHTPTSCVNEYGYIQHDGIRRQTNELYSPSIFEPLSSFSSESFSAIRKKRKYTSLNAISALNEMVCLYAASVLHTASFVDDSLQLRHAQLPVSARAQRQRISARLGVNRTGSSRPA